MKDQQPLWQSWSLSEWNQFLVDLFFSAINSENTPIYSFDASEDYLVSRLVPNSSNPISPLEFFVRKYKSNLSIASEPFCATSDWAGWSTQSPDLPFFYQLYLSLVVATSTNETVEEGDFRRRLIQILNLAHVKESSLQLLPWMWRQAASWTEEQISRGSNIRHLVLPDPGYETIIGYSKRLAFPCYLDRRRLINVLYQHGLNNRSSTNEILQKIGSNLTKFSPRFQSEYEVFRRAFEKSRKSVGECSIWKALQSISVIDLSRGKKHKDYRFRLELDLSHSPCTIETLVNQDAKNLLNGKFKCEPLAISEDEFSHRLVADVINGSEKFFIQRIFSLDDTVSALLSGSYLAEQIEQGFLCFSQLDRFTWVPSRGLPENDEIEVCIITSGTLAQRTFDDLKPLPFNEIASLDNWHCLGPVKSSRVAKLKKKILYKDLAALKWSMSIPMIHLIGAVRLSDGVLLLPPILPTVSAPEADSVNLRVRGLDEDLAFSRSVGFGEFQFPREAISAIELPCSATISAYKQNSLIGNLNRQFVATCLVPKFSEPSSKRVWLEESTAGHLRPWDEDGSELMKPNDDANESQISDLIEKIQSDSCDLLPHEVSHFQFRSLNTLPKLWSDLFECFVGKFSCKCGMSWNEVTELIEKASLTQLHSVKEIIETLIQNGHLQKLVNRRWIGIRLFAAQPRGYIRHLGEKIEIQFHGLLSISQRIEIQEFAKKLKADPEVAVFRDWDSVGIVRIIADREMIDEESFSSINIDFNTSPIELPLISPRELLEQTSIRTDLNSLVDRLHWNYERSCFLSGGSISSEIVLDEIRSETARPCYALNFKNSILWSSESREWALFLAHQIDTEFRGQRIGQNCLRLRAPAPKALSRYLLHFGPGVCGPNKTAESCTWVYGISTQEHFVRWLGDWGFENSDQQLSHAMSHWIGSMSSKYSNKTQRHKSAFARRYETRKQH